MDLSALIVEYRRRTDDAIEPYRVSDVEAARFATEAEKEACLRAHLLYDDSTDLTTLTLTASQATITLDPLILDITAASFTPTGSTTAIELDLTGMDWIRERCDWQTLACARPWKLAQGRGTARLYPLPSLGGTLQLAVYRLPALEMEDDGDEPEISVQHHDGLIDWMVYRGYQTKDAESEDRARGSDALALFEQRFGSRSDADTLRRQTERRRITTRMI